MSDTPPPQLLPTVPTRTAYEAPRVQSLGPWAAVTLAQSVPINPGAVLFPQESRDY